MKEAEQMLRESKVANSVISEILDPIKKQLETGIFFYPNYTAEGLVRLIHIRKYARAVAKEYGRPFVQAGYRVEQYKYSALHRRYLRREEPLIVGGWLQVPKRQYLMPLVAPLLLAADDKPTALEKGIGMANYRSMWKFYFHDGDVFEAFIQSALSSPEIVAAIKRTTKKTTKRRGTGR